MKLFIGLLLTAISINHSWAETRSLTKQLAFTEMATETEFKVDWPLKQTKEGAAFTIRRLDGSLFLQAMVKDSNRKDLFANNNTMGKYRYYYPNGKPKLEGTWDKNGTPIGLETEYSETGLPQQVIRYVKGSAYITEKYYHKNGQVSFEGIGYDGHNFKEGRYYYPDGKLKERQYNKKQNGIIKARTDNYDQAGKIVRYTEKYGDDPIIEITYNADGKILKKNTTMLAEERVKKERFTPQGQLTDLTQYDTRDDQFLTDGQQIQTYDGETHFSFYRDGKRQGEVKTVKDGKIIYYGHYRDDKPIGKWFDLNSPERNSFSFHSIDANEKYTELYDVGLDYISYDSKGMPIVNLPFKADTRQLPQPGTLWYYNTNGKTGTALMLLSVKDNIVNYRLNNHEIQEDLNNYTPVSTPVINRQILSFPLTLGKTWENDYQKQIKMPGEDNAEWGYTYQAKSFSSVSGAEKITVAGGTFDTLVIERLIHWTKSNPYYHGKSSLNFECATKICQVSGYTKEVIWYAPAAGRGVLKSVAINGISQQLPYRSNAMRNCANCLVTELMYIGNKPPTENKLPAAKYAHQLTDNAFSQGFPLLMNNTWEFFMIHNTLIE